MVAGHGMPRPGESSASRGFLVGWRVGERISLRERLGRQRRNLPLAQVRRHIENPGCRSLLTRAADGMSTDLLLMKAELALLAQLLTHGGEMARRQRPG